MSQAQQNFINTQLQIADALLVGRDAMLEPQDLPGRYGRVVAAIDRVLAGVHSSYLAEFESMLTEANRDD
jgi:hypothetical protein